MESIKINIDRLWNNLMDLGKIGFDPDTGVTRCAMSKSDEQARQWFIGKLKSADLEVKVDGVLNVIGRLNSTDKNAKVLAIGSHLDTVPRGGMFDGALGVLAGLEVLMRIKEAGVQLPFHLEVIAFNDEEGAHISGTLGSRGMISRLSDDDIYKKRSKEINSFYTDLVNLGYDPALIPNAKRSSKIFKGYLEMHIEQGPFLESGALEIGVVTAFAGIKRYLITVQGKAGHSGTTPMSERSDALVLSAPFFNWLPKSAKKVNPEMVATIGYLQVKPGAANVIPGNCEFIVEMRSQNGNDLDVLSDEIIDYVEHHNGFSAKVIYDKKQIPLNSIMIDTICKATKAENKSYVKMPSGAGHDAQTFAGTIPSGMIFIPCKEGISHNPDEWANKKDAGNGCAVLLRTVLMLMEIE